MECIVFALRIVLLATLFNEAGHHVVPGSLSLDGAVEETNLDANLIGGGAGIDAVGHFLTGEITVSACRELFVASRPRFVEAVRVAFSAIEVAFVVDAVDESVPLALSFLGARCEAFLLAGLVAGGAFDVANPHIFAAIVAGREAGVVFVHALFGRCCVASVIVFFAVEITIVFQAIDAGIPGHECLDRS